MSTGPDDETHTHLIADDSVDAEGELCLLLYHRDGVRVVPLLAGEPRIVGRSWPADVVVKDRSLSRKHAEVELDGATIKLRDLGSTNGTKLNGARIEEAEVTPGDAIGFGALMGTVQQVPRRGDELEGVDGHDRFSARVEEEVLRSRAFDHAVSLAMVRSHASAHVAQWLADLRSRLRSTDRVGLYGPHEALVLLPESRLEDAIARLQNVEPGTHDLRIGIASLPTTATTADALVEQARQAARTARAGTPKVADGAVTPTSGGPIIASASMRELYATVDKVAASDVPALVLGETGAGKELVARALHERSRRREGPFCCVNCGAIPATLMESTLFGHVKGAFTGADRDATGVFEEAHRGTVFLDEIGELSPAAQAALLRVLETKRVVRVGSHEEREVDVRVVAATHRDLEAMAADGEFRQDLIYRLNTVTMNIPPLRERIDDIDALSDRFLSEATDRSGAEVNGFGKDARKALRRYRWPGNVRELRNAIERAVVVCSGAQISADDLPERVREEADDDADPEVSIEAGDLRAQMKDYETRLILDALRKTGGNQKRAAELLNLPVRTLAYKMTSLGIKKTFES